MNNQVPNSEHLPHIQTIYEGTRCNNIQAAIKTLAQLSESVQANRSQGEIPDTLTLLSSSDMSKRARTVFAARTKKNAKKPKSQAALAVRWARARGVRNIYHRLRKIEASLDTWHDTILALRAYLATMNNGSHVDIDDSDEDDTAMTSLPRKDHDSTEHNVRTPLLKGRGKNNETPQKKRNYSEA